MSIQLSSTAIDWSKVNAPYVPTPQEIYENSYEQCYCQGDVMPLRPVEVSEVSEVSDEHS